MSNTFQFVAQRDFVSSTIGGDRSPLFKLFCEGELLNEGTYTVSFKDSTYQFKVVDTRLWGKAVTVWSYFNSGLSKKMSNYAQFVDFINHLKKDLASCEDLFKIYNY